MSKIDSSKAYFDRKSEHYNLASQGWLWRWLRLLESSAIFSLLGDITGVQALELGCGSGYYSQLMIERGVKHIYAVDISNQMLSEIKDDKITVVLSNVNDLNLEKQFPVILSAGLLEFVQDASTTFLVAASHAEQGARFIVLAPRISFFGYLYKLFHRRNKINIKLFHIKQLRLFAGTAGWEIVSYQKAGLFSMVILFRKK